MLTLRGKSFHGFSPDFAEFILHLAWMVENALTYFFYASKRIHINPTIIVEGTRRFLEALPVGKFFGVGNVTEARLKVLGIVSGDDLKHVSLERLQELFGKRGILLYQFVRGEDDRAIQPERERKSVGKETTFADDMINREDMLRVLEHLSEHS